MNVGLLYGERILVVNVKFLLPTLVKIDTPYGGMTKEVLLILKLISKLIVGMKQKRVLLQSFKTLLIVELVIGEIWQMVSQNGRRTSDEKRYGPIGFGTF